MADNNQNGDYIGKDDNFYDDYLDIFKIEKIKESTEIDLLNIDKLKQHLYYQYSSLYWLRDYFNLLDEFIDRTYFKFLKEFWAQRSIESKTYSFLDFYARNYLGIIRPRLGEQIKGGMLWDEGYNYDDQYFWDAYNPSNVDYIDIRQFSTYLKFIYNYNEPTWTIDAIMRFAETMINAGANDTYTGSDGGLYITANNMWVLFNKGNKISIVLPVLEQTDRQIEQRDNFIQFFNQYQDEMTLPFFDAVEVILDPAADPALIYLLTRDDQTVVGIKVFETPPRINQALDPYNNNIFATKAYARERILASFNYNIDDFQGQIDTTPVLPGINPNPTP